MNWDVSLNAEPLDQIKIDKNLYEILGVDQNANHLTIKDAYLRQKQTFERNSLALYSISNPQTDSKLLEEIDHAYEVLSCSFAKENYDKELSGGASIMSHISSHSVKKTNFRSTEGLSKDAAMQFDTLGREFGPGSGKQLRSFRKWLGIELEEVQQVTKISPQILRSIENESFQLLPDIVYVKGFVRTCLRYYKIPNKEEFEKLFTERYKNWKQTSNQ